MLCIVHQVSSADVRTDLMLTNSRIFVRVDTTLQLQMFLSFKSAALMSASTWPQPLPAAMILARLHHSNDADVVLRENRCGNSVNDLPAQITKTERHHSNPSSLVCLESIRLELPHNDIIV